VRHSVEQVRHLPLRPADLDLRVQQPRRADDLLDDLAPGLLQLVGAGRGAHVHHPRDDLLEFLERERAVVERAGQAEPVVHEDHLALAVAVVHRADLRDRHVALVDHQHPVAPGGPGEEVVEQGEGALARAAPVEVARVVLDARAVADLLDHLQVVLRARQQALGLEQLALGAQLEDARVQLLADGPDRFLDRPLLGHVVHGGEDEEHRLLGEHLAGRRVDQRQALDLVPEQLDADGVLLVGGVELDGVAPDAERAALEVVVPALVLHVGQRGEELAAVQLHARAQGEQPLVVGLRRPQPEDAADRGDDDGVAPAQQVAGGGEAEAVEVVVARGVLLDVDVPLGDVGLGLVVVVVGDEVVDGVVGQKLAHLLEELGGEGLVVAEDERGPLEALDDVRHGERLAGPGGAEQGDGGVPAPQALDEAIDRRGLVARGGHLADDLDRALDGSHRPSLGKGWSRSGPAGVWPREETHHPPAALPGAAGRHVEWGAPP
jgi:hypothetical protein